MTAGTAWRWSFWGGLITGLTVLCAILWAFPLYWGVITSLKPEDEVVRSYIELWPDTLTFQHCSAPTRSRSSASPAGQRSGG